MKIHNIPPLRFKNFNDEWENTKLGKIGKTKSGVGFPDSEQGGNSGIPFYKVSDMNNLGNEFHMTNANNYVTVEQIRRKKWMVIEQLPSVIFAKVGAAIMLDRKRLVKEPFLIDNNMMAYIFNDHWDTQFGKTLFDNLRLSAFAQTGALPSFNGTDIEAIKVSIPTYDEQSVIGSLFQTLDELLSAYKDNLSNYQAFKASMLSKMFPKAGQTTPEIRLKGFDGEWEEKKFNSLVKRVSESSCATDLPKVEFEDIISGEGRLNKDVSKKFDGRKGTRFKSGFILYGKLRPYLNNWLLPKFDGVALGDFWVFDPQNNDSEFIFYLIQSNRYQKVANDTSGTKMPRSDWKTVANTLFAFPILEEQQAIGSFFSNLDNLISSYQEKINQLETLKKKLLLEMFV